MESEEDSDARLAEVEKRYAAMYRLFADSVPSTRTPFYQAVMDIGFLMAHIGRLDAEISDLQDEVDAMQVEDANEMYARKERGQ